MMRLTRFSIVLMSIAVSVSMFLTASAQSAYDELNEALMSAAERYTRVYTQSLPSGTAADDPQQHSLPSIGAIILVMNTEDDAEQLYDYFMELSNEDGYSVDDIDDLGDEAALIVEPSPATSENIVMARNGEVITMGIAEVGGTDPALIEDIVRFTLDHGRGDVEPVIDDEGFVTGGWAEAFPEPEEVEGLEDFEASPVILFGLPEPIQIATPAPVKPVEVSPPKN